MFSDSSAQVLKVNVDNLDSPTTIVSALLNDETRLIEFLNFSKISLMFFKFFKLKIESFYFQFLFFHFVSFLRLKMCVFILGFVK